MQVALIIEALLFRLRQKEAIYLRAYKAPYGELPNMSIENLVAQRRPRTNWA